MTTLLSAGRVLPIGLGSRRAWLLIERNLFVYRSGWLVMGCVKAISAWFSERCVCI